MLVGLQLINASVADLCQQSGATPSCVEQEDEFALRIIDEFSETMKRRQRYNDQTAAVVHLSQTNNWTVLAVPQMHTCQTTVYCVLAQLTVLTRVPL